MGRDEVHDVWNGRAKFYYNRKYTNISGWEGDVF